jgi:probable phosphoglycerate mutase
VTTVLLARHGLTTLTGPVLAGWTAGVQLDERGRAQAQELAVRLAPVPLAAIVSSPLERCVQTAAAIAANRDGNRATAVQTDEQLGECRYGDWTGKPIKKLVKDPLWRVVQAHPSGARFPGPDGEALADMQHRAVHAVRSWNERLGPDACYLICSHGDVIKAVVADSLGLHLDQFQRIQVDPCSLTVIRYTETRPFLLRLNDTGGLAGLVREAGKKPARGRRWGRARRRSAAPDSDAVVGGGAGAGGAGPGGADGGGSGGGAGGAAGGAVGSAVARGSQDTRG